MQKAAIYIFGFICGLSAGVSAALILTYIIGNLTAGRSGELNIGIMILILPLFPVGAIMGAGYGLKAVSSGEGLAYFNFERGEWPWFPIVFFLFGIGSILFGVIFLLVHH